MALLTTARLPPSFSFTYPYGETASPVPLHQRQHVLHFQTMYFFPQAFASLPKKEAKYVIEKSLISFSAIYFYLFLRRQPHLALLNHIRLSSGNHTSNNPYDGSLPPSFSVTYPYSDTGATVSLPPRHLLLHYLTT